MWSFLLASLLTLATPTNAQPCPGELLLSADFAQPGDLPAGWTATGGHWAIADGHLRVTEVNGLALLTLPVPAQADVALECTARFDSAKNASRWLALVGRLDAEGFSLFTNRFDRTAANGLELARGLGAVPKVGWRVATTAAHSAKAETGVDHRLRVELRGGQARGFVDGQLAIATTLAGGPGAVGLLVSDATASFAALRVEKLPPAPAGAERGAPIVVGHRGNSAHAPENTLASAREAFERGASVVEIDVRRTKDGHLILLHDATFQRTAGDPRKPEDMTLDEVRALDAGAWKDARYRGEHVPTLEEMLDLAKGRGTLLFDLKQTGLMPDIAKLVNERGMADQVLMGPWTTAEAVEARRNLPDTPVVLIGSIPAVRPEGWFADLVRQGVRGFNSAAGSVNAEFMREAARRGMPVFAWTVNDPAEMRRLAALGVTGILTDDPALCVETLAAR